MHPGQQQDWYAVLGVAASAGSDEIAIAVEKMSRQANSLSVTAPQRSRLLRDQIRAIKQDLLSGDAQRQRYDQALARAQGPAGQFAPAEVPGQGQPPAQSPRAQFPPAVEVPGFPPAAQAPGFPPAAQAPAAQPGFPAAGQVPGAQPGFYRPAPGQAAPQFAALVGKVARFLQSGWTCAACGYDALPNDRFCHKCGAKIEPPAVARPLARPGQPVAPPGQPSPAPSPLPGQPSAAPSPAPSPLPG